MPQTHINIDGVKNDIRVLCTGLADSADAGLVEGVPLDPPDDSPGWVLSSVWVEHDTVQEKGEKGTVITRKDNPAYYQVWYRPKAKMRKKRGVGRPRKAKAEEEPTPEASEPAAAVQPPSTLQPMPAARPSPAKKRKAKKKAKAKAAPKSSTNGAAEDKQPSLPNTNVTDDASSGLS